MDLGIEKIGINFRQDVWDKSQNDKSMFLSLIQNAELGGTSSPEEAQRLYIVQKIINKLNTSFEEVQLLMNNIESDFQHDLHPVSTSTDYEERIYEILQYYFIEDNNIEFFLDLLAKKKGIENKVPAAQTIDTVSELSTPSETTTNTHSNTEPLEELKQTASTERTKIQEYLKLSEEERENSTISPALKAIIHKYYK